MRVCTLPKAVCFRQKSDGLISPSFLVVLFLLFILVISPVMASTTSIPLSISVDRLHQQKLPANHPLTIEFVAEAQKTYLLDINQGGLDLVVMVVDPLGQSSTFNSPLLRNESEVVLIDATIPGLYTATLISTEYTGATAHISIQLSDVTPIDDEEQNRVEVLRLISSASKSNHQGNLEGWNSALSAYEQAVMRLAKTDDTSLLARCFFGIATIEYWQLSRWEHSADLASRAAELYRKNGQQHLAANAVQLQATALIEKANEVKKTESKGIAPEARVLFEEALSLFQQALLIQQELDLQFDAAQIANNIGITYYYMGNYDEASHFYHEAATIFRMTREWQNELIPHSNLAVIDIELGRLIEGMKTTRRILDILPEDQSRQRADMFGNLGVNQLALGLPEDALQSFSGALDIQRSIDDLSGQARSLSGIGSTYYKTGRRELALEYLESALLAQQTIRDGRGQVATLKSIGRIKRERREFSSAIEAHTAASRLATAPIDRMSIQQEISHDLVAAGRPYEALELLSDIQDIADTLQNPKLLANSLLISGDAWLKTGQFHKALSAFEQAENIFQELGLSMEHSRAIFGTAKATRGLGDFEEAQQRARHAITSIEDHRNRLTVPEFRSFFLASRQEYYAFLIDTLMMLHEQTDGSSQKYLRQALSVSERSRARALVDLIREASIKMDDSRQISLHQRMAENRYRLNRLLDKPVQAGLETQIASVKQVLADIENELNLLQIEIRENNPGYAVLTNPQILDADQIQNLLDGDSVLLQYALGESRSFVWVVTRDAIQAWALPDRETIEQSARGLHDLLKVPAFNIAGKNSLNDNLNQLSGQILGPVQNLGRKRLIVAADGVLHYLPFSILVNQDKGSSTQLLLETHEIVHVPSISVLAAQRHAQRSRQQPTKEVVVFADPVFRISDQRFQSLSLTTGTQPEEDPSQQTLLDAGKEQLTRLPATAFEARAIVELVEPEKRLLVLGFDANLESVMQMDLVDYRVVHFATHGYIDTRYPTLSELTFSQYDPNGKSVNGSLHLHDIYKLEINAELVTMSACNTALGREISGEGLTGLTQGLMYSGAKSVLASLWQVPDRATAELMNLFYQNLLNKKQKPAEALRKAQLDLSSRTRWRNPYFWGAFILLGEWQ